MSLSGQKEPVFRLDQQPEDRLLFFSGISGLHVYRENRIAVLFNEGFQILRGQP